MRKVIGIGLVVSLFLLTAYSLVLARSDESKALAQASDESQAVNVGNKICPVSGDEVNEETKATVEYKGKIYNLCCSGCIEEFKKDPEKYVQKVNQELEGKAEEGNKVMEEPSQE